jgi:hypothetical protein
MGEMVAGSFILLLSKITISVSYFLALLISKQNTIIQKEGYFHGYSLFCLNETLLIILALILIITVKSQFSETHIERNE